MWSDRAEAVQDCGEVEEDGGDAGANAHVPGRGRLLCVSQSGRGNDRAERVTSARAVVCALPAPVLPLPVPAKEQEPEVVESTFGGITTSQLRKIMFTSSDEFIPSERPSLANPPTSALKWSEVAPTEWSLFGSPKEVQRIMKIW